jgi:hypothetical protein
MVLVNRPDDSVKRLAANDIRALEAQKPLWQPGTEHVYHSITLASASHSFECSEHSRTAARRSTQAR